MELIYCKFLKLWLSPEGRQQGMIQGTKTKVGHPTHLIKNKIKQKQQRTGTRATGIARKARRSDLKK